MYSGIICFIAPPKTKEAIYLSSLRYRLSRLSVLAFRKVLELLGQPLAKKGAEIGHTMWRCSFLSSPFPSH